MRTFGQPVASRSGLTAPGAVGSPCGSGERRVVACTKYGTVDSVARQVEGAPRIHIPKIPKNQSFADWFHREIRAGGSLHEYLRVERATTDRRLRRVARRMQNFEQNNRSEHKLECVVDARTFFRLRATDPDFFADPKNIKNLIRDTPECRPWRRK